MEKILKKNFRLLILCLVMMHSCVDQKESGYKSEAKMAISDSFEPFVMESEAIKIAENLNFSPSKVQNSPRELKSILGVPDENNIAAFYIINYKNAGFVILAGDKRSKPILAFSKTHQFKLDAQYYPSGLVGWLYGMKEKMERIREENAEVDEGIRQIWGYLGDKNAYIVPSNEDDPGIEEPEPCSTKHHPRPLIRFKKDLFQALLGGKAADTTHFSVKWIATPTIAAEPGRVAWQPRWLRL